MGHEDYRQIMLTALITTSSQCARLMPGLLTPSKRIENYPLVAPLSIIAFQESLFIRYTFVYEYSHF